MLDRLSRLNQWLAQESGVASKSRALEPICTDASFRRYFRTRIGGISRIVMDSPPEHENNHAFLELATRLHACGVSVPQVLSADLKQGFLLLTDLGSRLYLEALSRQDAEVLYEDAIEALLSMQQGAETGGLPPYGRALLLEEMSLFQVWLAEGLLKLRLSGPETQMLRQSFELLSAAAGAQAQVFVHRDYHSRNLLCLPEGSPGILDFQDAVIGPFTYDPVSLLKDCYIGWPRQRVRKWALSYFHQAVERQIVPALDPEDFLRSFALMGVQRHLKASGIFARLYLRDGKPAYLPELPRTLGYITELEESCPELGSLIEWMRQRVLPALKQMELPCTR